MIQSGDTVGYDIPEHRGKSARPVSPSLSRRDQILHPFTNLKAFADGSTGGPRIVTGGSGIRVRDRNGVELIDAFAGLYCVNVGYGRQEIINIVLSSKPARLIGGGA